MKTLIITTLLSLVACGDNSKNKPVDAGVDSPVVDASIDASCFTSPTTHAELLNACVDWQHVDKVPVTPLLNPDGTLPTLPP